MGSLFSKQNDANQMEQPLETFHQRPVDVDLHHSRPTKKRRVENTRHARPVQNSHTPHSRIDTTASRSPARHQQSLSEQARKLHKHKKRKVAIFLGYIGENYYGMQMNPGVPTIEQVLLTAFYKAGLVSDANKGSLSKIHWMRSARTDKGVSAAGQCVSAKLECELDNVIDTSLTDAINRELPDDIRIYGMLKATAGFNARSDCHRRRYEYMFPVRLLGGCNGIEKEVQQGEGDPRVAKLSNILRAYQGTHCFANFTDGLSGSDATAKRYMIRVVCGQPFLPPSSGVYYVTVEIYGQSFVLHQIRKMVGLALFVYLGHAPAETIPVALSPDVKIPTPMAPALGLLLDSLTFDNYNVRFRSALGGSISVDEFANTKNTFKYERIYKKIAERERMERVLEAWVKTCNQKVQYKRDEIVNLHAKFVLSDSGRQEKRKAYAASLYPIKTRMEEFIHPSDEQSTRLALKLQTKYEEVYGTSATFLLRAPGRIIMIGEHLDYNGLPVIGAALSQGTMIAGCLDDTDRIEIKHLESDAYEIGQLRADGARMAMRSNDEHAGPAKDSNWQQYVSWGIKALVQSLSMNKKTNPGGGRLMIAGDLPRAAGLGSSSSLVTASALAAARMNRKRIPKQELALLAAEGERIGAGTKGGAVDHMLSMCGIRGGALQVAFSPHLKLSELKLPEGVSLFAVGCGVKAEKGFDDFVKSQFNLRAAECRVASALLARRLDVHLPKSVTTPGQLLFQAGKTSRLNIKTVSELKVKAGSVMAESESLSLQEIKEEIDLSDIELENRFLQGAQADAFQVGKRMAHVFSETERVEQFASILQNENGNAEDIMKSLGQILNDGHCSLRDMYESSCTEADELVKFCVENGALGSRLTGAGWGGYTINIVADEKASSFENALVGRVGTENVERVTMASGACIFAIHSSYGRSRDGSAKQ